MMSRQVVVMAALLSGCSVEELSRGLVVTVMVEPASPRSDTDGFLSLTTDRGYDVRLRRAYLASSAVEIFPCARPSVADWLIGRAEAHPTASPTRLAAAIVEPLTGAGPRSLGQIRPPPDHYCRISYTSGPADRDASGMPDDGVMLGKTLYLEGTSRPTGEADWQPLVVSSSSSFSVEVDVAGELFGASTQPTIVIRKQAERWLDQVDLEARPAEIADAVLRNVRNSIGLELR
jgi:hypothetical protein